MDRELHYIQDALEAYCVAKLTELSENDGLSISNDSHEKYRVYKEYCDTRQIDPSTDKKGKVYYKLYNEYLPVFWNNLKNEYPDSKIDFVDVEKEYRNLKKKGDFLIKVENGVTKSVSLKAYKKSIKRIQVCSGTFNSFITNFLFDGKGVGTYYTESGDSFNSKNVEARDSEIEKLGLGSILPDLHELDRINAVVKEKFVYGTKSAWYQDIEQDWVHDRKSYGHSAKDLTLKIISENFTDEQVKSRLLEQVGFNGEEELLLLDPDRVIDSITNEKFKTLIHNVRFNSSIEYYIKGQGINFDFIGKDGSVLLSVNIPFTLNSNGAWFLPKNKKGSFNEKEEIFLEYGQRRPKKSKELATSINSYVNLGKTGILG
tara:strand:- start:19749 stop:20867 length:1119 start_codon:yes stop_codon:yes gene_type:complete